MGSQDHLSWKRSQRLLGPTLSHHPLVSCEKGIFPWSLVFNLSVSTQESWDLLCLTSPIPFWGSFPWTVLLDQDWLIQGRTPTSSPPGGCGCSLWLWESLWNGFWALQPHSIQRAAVVFYQWPDTTSSNCRHLFKDVQSWQILQSSHRGNSH